MEIQFGQLMRTLRRRWWVVVILPVVLGLLGFSYGRSADITYTATTSVLVTARISGDEILADSARVATYQNLISSGPVLDLVILDLDLGYTRDDLAPMVTTSVVRSTQIINISVTSDDPQEAADIANSITRNFVTIATELSVNEIQKDLDSFSAQVETLRGQIVVIDSRLAKLDADSSDPQVQAEISGLKRDRLQTSQTLADLEISIRELTRQLNTMSIPVVVADFAKAPGGFRAVNPLLLACVGAFVGALVGAAWIVWVAATDKVLRDRLQIVSEPLLANVKFGAGNDEILIAKILGAAGQSGAKRVAVVSAAPHPYVEELQEKLRAKGSEAIAANGVLVDASELRKLAEDDAAVVVAVLNSTLSADLEELAEVFGLVGAQSVGTVMVAGG